jgi:hypothetical protein
MPYGVPVAGVALFLGWLLSNGSEDSLLSNIYSSDTVNVSPIWCLLDKDHYSLLLTVVLPLFIVNLVGNTACVDQARICGEEYDESTVLFLDAVSTLVGATGFGSCVPTCINLGSVGYKGLGATYLYISLNAVILLLLALSFSPLVHVLESVPRVSAVGLLVYIGLIVTGDSFKERRHVIALVFGLVPAIVVFHSLEVNQNLTDQYTVLSKGYMLVSMIFASTLACIIDRRFINATLWMCGGALATTAKLIHAEKSQDCVVGYFTSACVCAVWASAQWHRGEREADFDVLGKEFQVHISDTNVKDIGNIMTNSKDNASSVPTTPVCTPIKFSDADLNSQPNKE